MTEPISAVLPDYGDARRAAVFLRHYCAGDPAGVCAVLAETAESQRWVELLLCFAQLAVVVQPVLVSEPGLAALQDIVLELAGAEHEPLMMAADEEAPLPAPSEDW